MLILPAVWLCVPELVDDVSGSIPVNNHELPILTVETHRDKLPTCFSSISGDISVSISVYERKRIIKHDCYSNRAKLLALTNDLSFSTALALISSALKTI